MPGKRERRYIHGDGDDDPLYGFEGPGLDQPRFPHVNHQGSVIAVAGPGAQLLAINTYDEYGIPGPAQRAATALGTHGRFQYTGQAWLPELGMYYYKARIYSPGLGRFLQTDPIGYDDQINLYAYVGNDPLNMRDGSGKQSVAVGNCMSCHSTKTPTQTPQRAPIRTPDLKPVADAAAVLGYCWMNPLSCVSAAGQILFNENKIPEGPLETDNTGKVKNDVEVGDIGESELDDAIAQLDHSIGQRQLEDKRYSRGNPNGTPQEKLDNKRHKGHVEKINREKASREELKIRRERRDSENK